MLNLWGVVSPPWLAGHTSLSPEGCWNLNSECRCSCYWSACKRIWERNRRQAQRVAGGKDIYPAPQTKARNRIYEGPEFEGGKRGLL